MENLQVLKFSAELKYVVFNIALEDNCMQKYLLYIMYKWLNTPVAQLVLNTMNSIPSSDEGNQDSLEKYLILKLRQEYTR